MFENGVMKNVIGPKMDEVILVRVLLKMHTEELNDL